MATHDVNGSWTLIEARTGYGELDDPEAYYHEADDAYLFEAPRPEAWIQRVGLWEGAQAEGLRLEIDGPAWRLLDGLPEGAESTRAFDFTGPGEVDLRPIGYTSGFELSDEPESLHQYTRGNVLQSLGRVTGEVVAEGKLRTRPNDPVALLHYGSDDTEVVDRVRVRDDGHLERHIWAVTDATYVDEVRMVFRREAP